MIAPSRRLNTYRRALIYVVNSHPYVLSGLCFVFYNVCKSPYTASIRNYPELMKRKPECAELYWFSVYTEEGKKARMKLLRAAIKELVDKGY